MDSKDNILEIPDEMSQSDGALRAKKRKHEKRRRNSHKKCEKHKGKQPKHPAGFRELMSSISMAGHGDTVSRHERLGVPTSVTFGKGNNIPHGMKFAIKGKEDKGKNRRYSVSSEDSRINKPGNGGDPSQEESEEPNHSRGCHKTPDSSSSSSSGSTESSSRSLSPSQSSDLSDSGDSTSNSSNYSK